MLGVIFGVLLDDLPGLGRTPAIAIGMAAFAVAMLRLPLSSIVLVTPSCWARRHRRRCHSSILAAIAAFVVTELIDPPGIIGHDSCASGCGGASR